MRKLLVVALVVAFFIVPYFAFDKETRVLDEKARASLSGSFVKLTDGFTWYELGGPQGGRPIVLIHGYSIPSFLWDDTFKALSAAGFRVLRYDMFGRGFSDQPKATYNAALFERQLLDLLGALQIKGPVDLAAVSMGGIVAMDFAVKHPEMVRKAALISPMGFPQDLGMGPRLMRIPVFGD
jgi:pimeloyl-ACP methyl ester carboxylesterase